MRTDKQIEKDKAITLIEKYIIELEADSVMLSQRSLTIDSINDNLKDENEFLKAEIVKLEKEAEDALAYSAELYNENEKLKEAIEWVAKTMEMFLEMGESERNAFIENTPMHLRAELKGSGDCGTTKN